MLKELGRIRHQVLQRNSLFNEELEELKGFKDRDDYPQMQKAFCERWSVSYWDGVWSSFARQDIVRGNTDDVADGRVILAIDIRYPKETIMRYVEQAIDSAKECHEIYTMAQLHLNEHWKASLARKEEASGEQYKEPEPHYTVKRIQDLESYELYLKVWDLKKDGYSYSDIQAELDLNSAQTARNYYKAAQELITKGVPGYFPFPAK